MGNELQLHHYVYRDRKMFVCKSLSLLSRFTQNVQTNKMKIESLWRCPFKNFIFLMEWIIQRSRRRY